MTKTTALIYAQASMTFAGQLLAYTVEKNWRLLLASLLLTLLYHGVVVPEADTFRALVLGPEGLHATGQRIFGVVSF